MSKAEQDEEYADLDNIESVEYLDEEHVIEEYEEQMSEEMIPYQDQEPEPEQEEEPFQENEIEEEGEVVDIVIPTKISTNPIQSQSITKPIPNPTPAGKKSSLFTEGECEIFGVFVANEMKGFRDLTKRRTFKRKVLQLLLEMESDD